MSKKLYKIIEIIGIMIIAYFGFKLFPYFKSVFKAVWKLLMPFLVGFGIAFLFEPLIEWLEKKKVKRKISVILIVVLFCGILFVIFRFGIPMLFKQISGLIDMIPGYLNSVEDAINNFKGKIGNVLLDLDINYSQIGSYLNGLFEGILDRLGIFLQRSFSSIINVLMVPIIAIYFMIDYVNIENFVKELLMNHNEKEVYIALIDIKRILRQYFKGVVIVMLILSLVSSICFMIMGLEYSLIFGLIVGITDIIPYIGPYIGGGIVIIFTFVSHPKLVIPILIIMIVIQTVEGNYLTPKIQSNSLNTHPLIVLASIIIFGELFGIIGMIIAVPIVKVIEIVIKSVYSYKKS